MSPEIAALLAKRLAAPKQFRVVTAFEDGNTRHYDIETLAQARNYATGEYRKIGKNLINRDTGEHIRVVTVDIQTI